MSTNKILIAGLVGGVVAFFLGFLFFGLILSDFFAANVGSAGNIARAEGEMLWVPMIVGHLAWGMLFAVVFGRWAGIKTFSSGAAAGAVIAFLVATTFDMIMLGSTHIMNLTGAIADIVVMTLIAAVVGGVVGVMLGRE